MTGRAMSPARALSHARTAVGFARMYEQDARNAVSDPDGGTAHAVATSYANESWAYAATSLLTWARGES